MNICRGKGRTPLFSSVGEKRGDLDNRARKKGTGNVKLTAKQLEQNITEKSKESEERSVRQEKKKEKTPQSSTENKKNKNTKHIP